MSHYQHLNDEIVKLQVQKQALEVLIRNLESPEVIEGMKAECIGEISYHIEEQCPNCVHCDDDEVCETCGDGQVLTRKIIVSWTIMKDVYRLMHGSKIKLLNQQGKDITGDI